jgi:purine-binding chemotaxis protein CheW
MATQSVIASRAGKYVTFQLSRHYFAIEARRVRQVMPAKEVHPIEHPLPFVRGALIIKGRRVPVVDVRDRLGLRDRGSHPRSSVVLVDIPDVCGVPYLGIVADRMTDVLEFRDRDIRDNVVQLPPYGRPYGRPKTLLNVDLLLSAEEWESLKSIF